MIVSYERNIWAELQAQRYSLERGKLIENVPRKRNLGLIAEVFGRSVCVVESGAIGNRTDNKFYQGTC